MIIIVFNRYRLDMISHSANTEILRVLKNPKFHCRLHYNPLLAKPVLRQLIKIIILRYFFCPVSFLKGKKVKAPEHLNILVCMFTISNFEQID